jgi:hypothetical protein
LLPFRATKSRPPFVENAIPDGSASPLGPDSGITVGDETMPSEATLKRTLSADCGNHRVLRSRE